MNAPQRDNIDALDGLRGLAALTVLISHLSNQTQVFGGILGAGAGQFGVMLFFALSGFLMSRIYIGEHATLPAFRSFFKRRVARVFPLYILLVIGSVAFTFAGLPVLYSISLPDAPEHLLFIHGSSVLWTIPIEVQFYAIFPLIWLAVRRFGVGWIVPAILVLCGLALAGATKSTWLPNHLQYFLLGIIVAKMTLDKVPAWLFGLAFAAFVTAFPRVSLAIGLAPGNLWGNPVYLIVVGCLLATSVRVTVLAHPVARFFGKISYSLYLLHIPVMATIGRTTLVENDALYIAAVLAVSIAVATISYFLVEGPARSFLNEYATPTRRRSYQPAL